MDNLNIILTLSVIISILISSAMLMKKKEKPKGKVISRVYIPKEHVQRMYELYDRMETTKAMTDRFNYWKFVFEKINKDPGAVDGYYKMNSDFILKPYFEITTESNND